MAVVVELLEGILNQVPLTGEGVAAEFAAQEWTAGGRPKNGFEMSWHKQDVAGWVHPYNGGIRVEFTVWMRDTDEDTGYFDDLDSVYEEGERFLAAFLPEIESSTLAAHLTRDGEYGGGRGRVHRVQEVGPGRPDAVRRCHPGGHGRPCPGHRRAGTADARPLGDTAEQDSETPLNKMRTT
ncbi:hypothetical protein [Streptomyces sp. NPDC088400]|uniref:hypothetical protein n=1 Tax=Streptomyces sp. NPDC088400 TaxID=3365861 RepID=UPI00382938ED